MVEEPAFAFDAAAVAGERAICSDDAVAGEDDGDGIGSIGGADGADGGWMADPFGELAVGGGCAAGDGAEGLPDFSLKRSAGGFDGDVVDGVEVAGEVACDGLGEAVGIGCGLKVELARSILIGEMAMDGVFVLGEEGEAQSAGGIGDEHHLADGGGKAVEE